MRELWRRRLKSKRNKSDVGILRKLLYNIITVEIISDLYQIVLEFFKHKLQIKKEITKYFYEVIDPKISYIVKVNNILLSGLILPNCIMTKTGVLMDIVYLSDTQQPKSLFAFNITCSDYINVEVYNDNQFKTKAAETLINF